MESEKSEMMYMARMDLNELVFFEHRESDWRMNSMDGRNSDHDNTKKIDFDRPIRVFILSTGTKHLHEIYSSKKDTANNKLYVSLGKEGRKRPRKQKKNTKGNNNNKQKKNRTIEFLLTGPVKNLVTQGFFEVIIHQDDDTEEEFDDDSHLQRAYTDEKIGRASESDVFYFADLRQSLMNKREGLFSCNIVLSAGLLQLVGVFFNHWRSITVVGVKWLHKNSDDDDAATTTDLITGGLYLRSFKGQQSAVFGTPEGKAIKVKHGQSIPLLRSTFVVIDGSSFDFKAIVRGVCDDDSLSVIDYITFECDDFSIANNFTHSRVIDGKIEVVVTMKPN